MANAVIVLNPQNDFVRAYPEGKAVAENIAAYIRKLASENTTLFTVQDTHHDHPEQHIWPYPLIGHYGHDIAPEIAAALYDTRMKYSDICYNMKTNICAYETIGQMNKQFDNIIIMGFRREDLMATAEAIKEVFPEWTKISFAARGITYDMPNDEKLIEKGWEIIY